MMSKSSLEKELRKVKKLYFNASKERGEWRAAFDQGVMQALTWALGKGEKPNRGLELRLIRKDQEPS